MSRRMPPLEVRFASFVDEALGLAEVAERIRAVSPPGSLARHELRGRRLDALYEIAYLRVFLLWEDFLEQSFIRYLCGYPCTLGPAVLRVARFGSLSDAEGAILGTNDWVTWANPNRVVSRSQQYINSGFHEAVLKSNLSRLGAFNSVRNRIAHRSAYARHQFDLATTLLVGRRFPGSSAGIFLRQMAVSLPAPESWLRHIASELKAMAVQICP